MNPRERASMRREVLIDILRERPLLSTSELSAILLAETGGPPAMLTGAIFAGPWTVYSDLSTLAKQGVVHRWKASERRAVSWSVADSGGAGE
jgi:hypothetical protein